MLVQSVLNFWGRYRAQAINKNYKDMVKIVQSTFNIQKSRRGKGGGNGNDDMIRRNIGEILTALLYLVKGPVTDYLDNLIENKCLSLTKDQLIESMLSTLSRFSDNDEANNINQRNISSFKFPLEKLLILLKHAESMVVEDLGNVKFSDLGHGTFLQILLLLEPSNSFYQLISEMFSDCLTSNTLDIDRDDIDNDDDNEMDMFSTSNNRDGSIEQKDIILTVFNFIDEHMKTGNMDVFRDHVENSFLDMLVSIEIHTCEKYNMKNFTEFGFEDSDSLSLFSFLNSSSLYSTIQDNIELKNKLDMIKQVLDGVNCGHGRKNGNHALSLEQLFQFIDISLGKDQDDNVGNTPDNTNIIRCREALCQWMNVDDVCDLGCGDMEHILLKRKAWKSVQSKASSLLNRSSKFPIAIGALTSSYENNSSLNVSSKNNDVNSNSSSTHQTKYSDPLFAIECLKKTPYLVNVGEHLQWKLLFEKYHGSIQEFCRIHSGDIIDEQNHIYEDIQQEGSIFQYNPSCSLDDLQSATEGVDNPLNSFQVAVCLVSLFVQSHGNIQGNVRKWTESAMIPMFNSFFATCSNSSENCLKVMCSFALSTLKHISKSLHKSLAILLIDPIFQCCGDSFSSQQIQQTLLSVCQSFEERSILHHIALSGYESKNGIQFMIIIDDFNNSINPPPSSSNLHSRDQCFTSAILPSWLSACDLNHQSSYTSFSSPVSSVHSSNKSTLQDNSIVENDDSNEISDTISNDNVDIIDMPTTDNELEGTATTTAAAAIGDDDMTEEFNAMEHAENCKKVIKHIREVGFGLDENGIPKDQSEDGPTGMLQRSLELLSTGLYSDKLHFVLELIQNADDNVSVLYSLVYNCHYCILWLLVCVCFHYSYMYKI